MGQKLTGRCLCGAVTFAVDAVSQHVDACHCGMCRRWTGGPMMTLQHAGPIDFKGREYIELDASSDAIDRGFCKRCGSALFTKLNDAEHYFLSAGTINENQDFRFAVEIFIDDKPAYYAFANDTQKMTGAEFLAAWAEKPEQS